MEKYKSVFKEAINLDSMENEIDKIVELILKTIKKYNTQEIADEWGGDMKGTPQSILDLITQAVQVEINS